MITKIIAASDLHIKNIKGLDEIREQFKKFIKDCQKVAKKNGPEATRIVLAGDIVHSKLESSHEALSLMGWFLKELDKICKTIVVCGNHDLNMSNLQRMDSITPIFEMCDFTQTVYIDRDLEYKSGSVVDDNIVWCLYSTFDGFNGPSDMEVLKKTNPDKTFVGLFHGDLNGAKNASGIALMGLEVTHFSGCDFVIAGHIHKQQSLKKGGIEVVYCGSLIQQDFGEEVYPHGYVLWDVPEKSWKFVKIKNESNGFYKFSVNSEEDLDNDEEKFLNPG